VARRGGAVRAPRIPQQQLSDTAPPDLQKRLLDHARALPAVSVGDSRISVPGAQAFILAGPTGDADAFPVPSVGEFAHLHPSYDGSLHLALPVDLAADLVTRGWGRKAARANPTSPRP
jgi:phospholipase/carboxylesterase